MISQVADLTQMPYGTRIALRLVMRTIKTSRLALNRETLRHLSHDDLSGVAGNGTNSRCSGKNSTCPDALTGACPGATIGCPGTGNTQNCPVSLPTCC